jgi:hypothetical protein
MSRPTGWFGLPMPNAVLVADRAVSDPLLLRRLVKPKEK